MAQLHKKAYNFKRTAGLSFLDAMKEEEAELVRLEKAAAKLLDGEIEGALVSFGVADGKAIYLVKSKSPLVLQHVPFFDGYRIDAAMIRGLRLADIQRRVDGDRMMRSIFARKSQQAAA
jgi:hypothetical protein